MNNNVTNSEGVNGSNSVNWSYGVNGSSGVDSSKGVNSSDGVNESRGVNWSNGVNGSDGVNLSDGVNESYGIYKSNGVSNALFLADKKESFSIFGIEVKRERFEEVRENLYKKLNWWIPKFNNAFELYVQNGGVWEKVKASEICSTLVNDDEPYEAWRGMPKDAIEYVMSLPEFNEKLFKRITGIDVEQKDTEDSDDECDCGHLRYEHEDEKEYSVSHCFQCECSNFTLIEELKNTI